MATVKGIDCAIPLTAEKAKTMYAAGIRFVCRYLVPAQYAWKRLTRAEAEAITAAGMKIVSIFQRGTNDAKGGAANGTRDGKAAYQEAKLNGQPEGTAIYFAVDYDAQPADYAAIEAYLRAAAAELPGYRVGVYGSYAVVEEMARRGACKHFWQTYAWSKGKLSKFANIYQYRNGQTLAGHQVDFNESFGGEGWWDTNPQNVEKTVDIPEWKRKDHDELLAVGLLTESHLTSLDETVPKWMLFALVNHLRKAEAKPVPQVPPEPEPQPPADPEPTPEPEPNQPTDPEPEQPQNYPPCFLGLPGPCVRDDSTIDWKGEKPPEQDLPPFDEIVERAKESVVRIQAVSYGTGWLIDDRHIVTAKHVIGRIQEFVVRFRDGRETKAVPVAIHSEADLAIIRLKKPTTRPALRIADVDKVMVGTEIAVIGHEDRRDWTEKYGRVEREQIPGQPWEFDVDASIKHGNSGGPVLDRKGDVLGVVAQTTGDCVNLLWFREWIAENVK